MSEDSPIEKITPVIVPASFFVTGMHWVVMYAFFGGSLFSMFGLVIVVVFDIAVGDVLDYFRWWYICFFLWFLLLMCFRYQKTFIAPFSAKYLIYADRIEYVKGKDELRCGVVVFDQVVDVRMGCDVIQRRRGAGTITVRSCQPFAEGEGVMNNDCKLVNVPRPQAVYELLCELVLKGRGGD